MKTKAEKLHDGRMAWWPALFVLAFLTAAFLAPPASAIDLSFTRSVYVNLVGDMDGPVAFGDIDNDSDGDLDIAYAIQTDDTGPDLDPGLGWNLDPADFQIKWRRNDPGSFSGDIATINYAGLSFGACGLSGFGPDQMTDLAIADMDGDLDGDIVAVTAYDGIFWFRNLDGAGTSWSGAIRIYDGNPDRANCLSYPNVYQIKVVDIDNDGDMDVLAAIGESGNAVGQPNENSYLACFYNVGGAFTKLNVTNPASGEVRYIYSVTTGQTGRRCQAGHRRDGLAQ